MHSSLPPTGRCLLVAAVLLCQLLPLHAQSKKGFARLEKGKFDAAHAAFIRDTANADLRAVAYFGLAKVWADDKNPAKNYRLAMQFQRSSVQAWTGMDAKHKMALTKNYKVTQATADQYSRTMASNAWRTAEKTTDLRVIDEFIEIFPKNASYVDRRARKKQAELIAAAARDGAKTYDDLSYLFQHHGDYLRAQLPSTVEPVEKQLFLAFLGEKGPDNIPQFYKDNPEHPLSGDPGRDAFPMAWKSTDLAPKLQFLAEFPSSDFVPYVQQSAVDLVKQAPLEEAKRQALPEDQRNAYAEVEWYASGKNFDISKPFQPEYRSAWLMYVHKTAPSYSALDALEKMYKYYVIQRDWTAALDLLKETKPLFNKQKTWFDDRLAILGDTTYGYRPVNLGPGVNTTAGEYLPVVTADGKKLYFCGNDRVGGIAGEDLFVSERSDTGWTQARLVKELSAGGNEAALSLTADGNRLLQFRNGRPFQSDKTATGWSSPVPLDVDVSAFPWIGQVQIAAGGQVMFIEVMGGRSGGIDLYLSRKGADGQWSKPEALDSLNTEEDERSAFLHPDLHTLYFSSSGYAGLGGLDVFKTTRLDDSWTRWSRPVNLGKEINTPGQDWGYVISTDGTTAWFGTQSLDNGEDIFSIQLPEAMRPEQVQVVELSVKDEKGKPLTEGKIVLKDAVTGEQIGTYVPNPTGETTTLTVPNDRAYTIVLETPGYYPQSTALAPLTAKSPELNLVWNAPKLADGVTQELNIFFDYDQAVLRPESNAELMRIAQLIQDNQFKVKLLGYTDNAGSTAYNLDLSKRRAEAARTALVALGVPAGRIVAEGFGESSPQVPNDTDANRAKNRRVMIQIVK